MAGEPHLFSGFMNETLPDNSGVRRCVL